jgi:hypothetical protein
VQSFVDIAKKTVWGKTFRKIDWFNGLPSSEPVAALTGLSVSHLFE